MDESLDERSLNPDAWDARADTFAEWAAQARATAASWIRSAEREEAEAQACRARARALRADAQAREN